MFCRVIVKNYLCNFSCKFLIKIESIWRNKIKEQALRHRRLMYCGGLSEAATRGVLKACNFIKKIPQRRCFPAYNAKFLRLPVSKKICDKLLFDCFIGSLWHGPKVLRSKLYDGIRLQGPSYKSCFLFLIQHLSS